MSVECVIDWEMVDSQKKKDSIFTNVSMLNAVFIDSIDHLISKCLFGVIVATEKPTKLFKGFLP